MLGSNQAPIWFRARKPSSSGAKPPASASWVESLRPCAPKPSYSEEVWSVTVCEGWDGGTSKGTLQTAGPRPLSPLHVTLSL